MTPASASARLVIVAVFSVAAPPSIAAPDAGPAKDAPATITAPAANTAPMVATTPELNANGTRPPDREPLLIARLKAATLPRDFIQLGADASPVLARYAKAIKTPVKGALLFLSAPGQFIGDDAVIAAALRQLPVGGWTVLAVQLPLLSALASQADYVAQHDQALARARTGLDHLNKEAIKSIIVVGRGDNVALARELAGDGASGNIRAVAALGPWSGPLGDNPLPLLELSPDRDRTALAAASARQQAALSDPHPTYKQFVLVGADHLYLGFEEEIARRIQGWAEHLPPTKAKAPQGS